MATISLPIHEWSATQHAGPMLNGYATRTATTTTVAQNATPGFLRSSFMVAFYRVRQGDAKTTGAVTAEHGAFAGGHRTDLKFQLFVL